MGEDLTFQDRPRDRDVLISHRQDTARSLSQS